MSDAKPHTDDTLERFGKVVCGDHWVGLSCATIDGSEGCPWCIASQRESERSQAEAELERLRDEARQLCDVAGELESAFPFDQNLKGLMLHVKSVRAALNPKSCRYCGSTDLRPEDGNVCVACDESPGAGVGPEDG